MTTNTISIPGKTGLWANIWQWLRAFDEAVHYDPTEGQNHRIEMLENKVRHLEANAREDNGGMQ